MARQKSATFQGVLVGDADSNSPTYTRVIENVIGDLARTFDRLTGSNGHSAADLIDHRDEGRGCNLGFPIWNQYIGRRITLWGANLAGAKHGSVGETNILAVPIFLGAGTRSNDTDLVLELFMSLDQVDPDRLRAHVVIAETSAFTELARVPLALDPTEYPGGQRRLFADFSGGGSTYFVSGKNILFVRMTINQDPPPHAEASPSAGFWHAEIGTLHSVSLHANRIGSQQVVGRRLSTSPFSVRTPAAGEGVGHRDFHTILFGDLLSQNAYLTVEADLNANGLLEYVTGWPCGGQSTYTHADHDGAGAPDATDPARSRFMAHTRSLYANEPEVPVPIFTDAMGAFKTDGGLAVQNANPPTYGMLDWYAPWPIQTARQTVRVMSVVWPDFDTAASKLRAMVLVGSDGAADVGTDWTAYIRTQNSASETTFGAFTALDANNRYWLATATAVGFLPDQQDLCELRLEKTSGALEAITQIVLLGWHVYFDP